jgi:farnesyl-diphosphate farnesyltransferase
MTERLDDAELDALLTQTSRTFALTIPLLPAPLRREVGVAYLLFRIADTLEDGELWDRERRVAALRSFETWLGAPTEEHGWQAAMRDAPPTRHGGYLALLGRADAVRGALDSMPDAAAATICEGVSRTAGEMARFASRQDERGGLVLSDVTDLRAYCYAVAGIVGEMLTELFVIAASGSVADQTRLRDDAAAFGEGLQLVNILKDAEADARDGRVYLPPSVPRESVVALAREDLARARTYTRALEDLGSPRGVIAFCTLPIRLAEATLDRLAEGGAKLTREEVMRIASEVTARRP